MPIYILDVDCPDKKFITYHKAPRQKKALEKTRKKYPKTEGCRVTLLGTTKRRIKP